MYYLYKLKKIVVVSDNFCCIRGLKPMQIFILDICIFTSLLYFVLPAQTRNLGYLHQPVDGTQFLVSLLHCAVYKLSLYKTCYSFVSAKPNSWFTQPWSYSSLILFTLDSTHPWFCSPVILLTLVSNHPCFYSPLILLLTPS